MRLNSFLWLEKNVEVEVDRPFGTPHPKYPALIYKVNYGFIPGTRAQDGEEIDAYILGPQKAIRHYKGTVIAVINRFDDNEDKLVVANKKYTKKDIATLTHFQEQYFTSKIIMKND